MSKNYCFHNGKRNVGGTAALLHKVKLDGGLCRHYQKVFNKLIEGAISEGIIEMKDTKLHLIKGGKSA